MNLRLTCACGWEAEGDEDAVVAAAQDHGRRLHNMDVTREEALAMAAPAEPDPPRHGT